MSDLLESYSLIAEAMLDDPTLALANAIVWLDPLWDSADAEFGEHEDTIGMALEATRIGFTDTYVMVLDMYRAGEDEDEIERLVSHDLDKRDIYVDELHELGYGIPMPAFGINLADPDTYDRTEGDDLKRLAQICGIQIDADGVTTPDTAEKVGIAVANTLRNHPDPRWEKVGWLLRWAFGCSGNSSVDWTFEDMGEVASMKWDEIEFALAIIDEANLILKKAKEGLALLSTTPHMQTTFKKNVKRALRACERETPNERHQQRFSIQLDWSSPDTGDDGAAVADSELLQLRDHAA